MAPSATSSRPRRSSRYWRHLPTGRPVSARNVRSSVRRPTPIAAATGATAIPVAKSSAARRADGLVGSGTASGGGPTSAELGDEKQGQRRLDGIPPVQHADRRRPLDQLPQQRGRRHRSRHRRQAAAGHTTIPSPTHAVRATRARRATRPIGAARSRVLVRAQVHHPQRRGPREPDRVPYSGGHPHRPGRRGDPRAVVRPHDREPGPDVHELVPVVRVFADGSGEVRGRRAHDEIRLVSHRATFSRHQSAE